MTAIESILGIFTDILEWFVSSLGTVSGLFWTSEGLTFIGSITVVAVGIAIITMVIAMVRSLLRLQ